ncbi:MAG: NAD(P)H-dependent oxidoreductase [Halobacteriovoraceae bacterium]|nr:NAD(P)H-dependent oxidoreductase [Halobacteriovoraceae bacterium]|tara:strand:+ start:13825 stop:14460 length:636 start_codon:yes stop_codon:yes gene_type:complete
MNSKILHSLNWRYACKKFDQNKKIKNEDLETILESLRLTPSSYGLQPWKFIIVEDSKIREELVGASWGQKQVAEASHLLVLCAPKLVDEKHVDAFMHSTVTARGQDIAEVSGFKDMLVKNIVGKDETWQYSWAKNQVYIALGQLLLTCALLNIDSCPMEGFKPKEYNRILGLDERGLNAMVVCPIGYRSEEDKYTKLAKSRFELKDLIIKI